ncbi:hypothetical protein [Micromonospora sp.]|uniref:hypothetical protein n=1 Tax=Micromonospora sp. TaxID=1876 RepID=UPI003B3BE078
MTDTARTGRWAARLARPLAAVAIGALAVCVVAAGRPGSTVAGVPRVDAEQIAEVTFPWRHLTVSSPSDGRVQAVIDDGSGRPTYTPSIGIEADASSYTELGPNCPAGSACDLTWRIGRDLTVVVTGPWHGFECALRGGPDTPAQVDCADPAVPG